MRPAAIPTQRREHHGHLVHLYESDVSLVACAVGFLARPLLRGEPALVVATPGHRELFTAALVRAGVDVAGLRRVGRYVEQDAEQALAQFTVGGRIDRAAFWQTIGRQVTALAGSRGGVHVYGEMVAQLWGDGDEAGALRLEGLWNDLSAVVPFRLCCAYPARSVKRSATAQIDDMLATHTSSSQG